MRDGPLTSDELATVISTCAGVNVDGESLARQPTVTFEELGVDSLGVLGVVSELERRLGCRLGSDLDEVRSPYELTSLVNARLGSEV